jgi:CheY-like chemotaxis protein
MQTYAAKDRAGPVSITMSARQILVVDDNPETANSLAMLLTLEGHRVRVALNGSGALAAVRLCVPDVIFLDLGLPENDGYEVGRWLRQHARGRRMFIVALTGWADDEARWQDEGFDSFLLKPASIDVLNKVIRELTANN